MGYRTNDSTLTLSLSLKSDEYNSMDYSSEFSFMSQDEHSHDHFTFDIVDYINKILEDADSMDDLIDWEDTKIIFDSDLYCESFIYG